MSTSVLLPVRRFVAPEVGGVLITRDLPGGYIHALAAARHLRNLDPVPPVGAELCDYGQWARLVVWARPEQVTAVIAAIGGATIWQIAIDIEGRWISLTSGAPAPVIGRTP